MNSIEFQRRPANKIVTADFLLHGTSLLDLYRFDKDLDLTLLSPNIPSTRAPTRHISHNSALHTVHRCICDSNCTAMYSCKNRLGALGWQASWEVHQPQRRCVGVSRCQHYSRLDRDNLANQGGHEPCHEPPP